MKILLIDDTKSIHTFVKFLLTKAKGVETKSVFNGAEGVQALTGQETFDLVLLDWEMPVLSGPETLVKLRENGVTVPVIMMTTKNAPEDIIKALELGAREYIMKPFTDDILFEKIQMVTGKDIKNGE